MQHFIRLFSICFCIIIHKQSSAFADAYYVFIFPDWSFELNKSRMLTGNRDLIKAGNVLWRVLLRKPKNQINKKNFPIARVVHALAKWMSSLFAYISFVHVITCARNTIIIIIIIIINSHVSVYVLSLVFLHFYIRLLYIGYYDQQMALTTASVEVCHKK